MTQKQLFLVSNFASFLIGLIIPLYPSIPLPFLGQEGVLVPFVHYLKKITHSRVLSNSVSERRKVGRLLLTLFYHRVWFAEKWARDLKAALLAGIHDMHREGLLHRDLKPDNLGILSREQPFVVLFDLGMTRMYTDELGQVKFEGFHSETSRFEIFLKECDRPLKCFTFFES